MKKRIFSCFAVVIAIVAALVVAFSFNSKQPVAYAESDSDNITETTILTKDDYFADAALWAALVKIAEQDFGGDGATIRAGDLKNATSLDLSNKNITSLDGLEYLFFSSSLKTLNLSNNYITEISGTHIDKMLGLENLDASNNKLDTVEIPASVALKTINIKNNFVSTINLSGMKQIDASTPAECDLRLNNFDNIENISLPKSSLEKLNIQLAQNYLADATVADFGGHNVSLQLQGMRVGNTTSTQNTYIRLNNDAEGGEYTNLSAKVYYRRGSLYFKDTVNIDDNLVATSDAQGKLLLPAGKMYIRYFNNGVELDNDIYESHEIDILPARPTMTVVVDGKPYDYTLGKGIKKDFEVIASTSLEDGQLYISINGADAKEGNIAYIKQRGDYTVSAHVKFDGLTSANAAITVKNTNTTGMTWGLIVLVALIVIVFAAIFITRWFRNGAVVSPLTDSEVRSIERRRNNLNRK